MIFSIKYMFPLGKSPEHVSYPRNIMEYCNDVAVTPAKVGSISCRYVD